MLFLPIGLPPWARRDCRPWRERREAGAGGLWLGNSTGEVQETAIRKKNPARSTKDLLGSQFC